MSKSSIHIDLGYPGYFSHNSRQSFSLSQVFFNEINEVDHSKEEALKIFKDEVKIRSKKYTERTSQKLQKHTVTHLSAIINLEQHHTLKDLKPLTDYLEKELDTKVVQIVIHRDEGKLVHKQSGEILTSGEHFFCNPENQKLYFDKEFTEEIDMNDWEMEKNYHAHVEFVGLTSEGKSIKRELTTWFFRKIQDKTAEVLDMERGVKTKPKYTKEQMIEIKSNLKPKKEYTNDKAYGTAFTAMAKKLGYWKPRLKRTKRKDTHLFKADKAKENELKAKAARELKNANELNKELRVDLEAKRDDYVVLESDIVELKQSVKDKDLVIEELKNKAYLTSKATTEIEGKPYILESQKSYKILFEELQTKIELEKLTSAALKEKKEEGEKRITELETQLATEKATVKIEIKEIEVEKIVYEEDTTRINTLEAQINSHEKTIADKETQISDFKTQNQALNEKITTLPSHDTQKELNTLKEDFQKLDSEYWELYYVAYDDDHIEQVADKYGIFHDRVISYKERYDQSELEIKNLKIKFEEKDEQIEILQDGYSKIEDTIFQNSEDRSVEDIVEGVNTIATILSNVTKYLKIGKEKIVELFADNVPKKEEVEKEQFSNTESVLPSNKENNSSPAIKPMKP